MAVAIVLLSVVVLVAFLVTREQVREPTKWNATTQVLIPARDEKGRPPEGVPPNLLQGQSTLALSGATILDALRAVPEDERLRVKFGVSLNERRDIVSLSATHGDTAVARTAADALADAFIRARRRSVAEETVDRRDSIRRMITTLSNRLGQVQSQLQATNLALPSYAPPDTSGVAPRVAFPPDTPVDVQLLVHERNSLITRIDGAKADYATAATDALTPASYATTVEHIAPVRLTPEPPSPVTPALIILAVGLALAIGAPYVRERLDRSIKDARTAVATLGAPVLSMIGPAPRSQDAMLAPDGTAHAAAFQTLAATSVATDRLPRAIMVTSPVGTTHDWVAANFAAGLAALGLRVALVATTRRQAWFAHPQDGDVDTQGGHPSRALTFDELLLRAQRGSLNGELTHDLAMTDLANLVVVPPGDAESLHGSLDGLPPLLDALSKAEFDVTVIAGPSLLEDPAATIVAWSTRHVLWAMELGGVTEADAREAASRLALAGVSPFGVALVGRQV